ncbi:DUF222 domain-containing protein [Gordonia phosphorivorans]|uniref:DUF222 domain-containing protein n=1 Tax=Gordonia phosphorivorans TaxID=1056982 RepID=A0ABV6H8W0_9ACTN
MTRTDEEVAAMDDDFDPVAFLAGLSTTQLLAVQETAEGSLAGTTLARHSDDGLLDLLELRERTHRRREVFDAKLYVEISDRGAYRKAGCVSAHMLYEQGLRLGSGETRRRKVTAASIGHLTSMTGEPLPAKYPATEAGLLDGEVGREHVLVIDEVMDKIPAAIDHAERTKAEAMLADAARRLTPAGLSTVGHRILAYLDPDGALTDDKDRRRRRTFNLQPQNRQLMSKVRAQLSPTCRAGLEVAMGQWAARGMNNPDDPDSPRGAADQPGLDPAVLAAAAALDDRTLGQRQHDALLAIMQWAVALGGQPAPERIPSQIVITVSDEDLARQAGIALTATGTRLPVTDLVEFAAHTIPYLEVFAGATSQVLYLGRGNRFASLAQRLALFGRDRGCTAPGCTVPFVRTQIHHMPDWADGGYTDIDRLGGACGQHNRWSGHDDGQWESTVLTPGPPADGVTAADAGRVAWRPAGRGGPWQINPIFHPDKLATDHHVPGVQNRLGPTGEPPRIGPPQTGPPRVRAPGLRAPRPGRRRPATDSAK